VAPAAVPERASGAAERYDSTKPARQKGEVRGVDRGVLPWWGEDVSCPGRRPPAEGRSPSGRTAVRRGAAHLGGKENHGRPTARHPRARALSVHFGSPDGHAARRPGGRSSKDRASAGRRSVSRQGDGEPSLCAHLRRLQPEQAECHARPEHAAGPRDFSGPGRARGRGPGEFPSGRGGSDGYRLGAVARGQPAADLLYHHGLRAERPVRPASEL
jgi:hypothetical protein